MGKVLVATPIGSLPAISIRSAELIWVACAALAPKLARRTVIAEEKGERAQWIGEPIKPCAG